MANLQYIGARYVPKFYENSLDPSSMEWESGHGYEALTVVTYNSDTYTSKIPVPSNVGNPAGNPTYWAKTADFNAALVSLQNEITQIESNLDGLELLESNGLSANSKTIYQSPLSAYMQAITGGTTYKSLQGAAFDTTRNQYALFIIIGAGSDVLMVILDDDLETVVNSQLFPNADLGHGNDFTYNPVIDRYVCTPANGDGNKILTINPTTLTIENTYTPTPVAGSTDERLAGIVYDADNDRYFALTGVGFWIINGDFTANVYVPADTLDALKFLPSGVVRWTNFVNNGITYKDGRVYVISQYSNNPRQSWVIVFNIDGSIYTTYQLPNYDVNTEYEAALTINDNVILMSQYHFFTVAALLLQNVNSDNFYSPFGAMQRIPAGSDLNDFYNYGHYMCASGDVASILNIPCALTGFDLFVCALPANLTQIFRVTVNNRTSIYQRTFTFSNDQWGAWRRVDENVLPLTSESIECVTSGYLNYQGAKVIFVIPNLHLNNTSTHPISAITATYDIRLYTDAGVYLDSNNQQSITDQTSSITFENVTNGVKCTLTLPDADNTIANHAAVVNVYSMSLVWA